LPAYVAQQLDDELAAQVQQHLATCEHCTERLRKLRQASSTGQLRPQAS
jgi:anti-sigma factor RsiW